MKNSLEHPRRKSREAVMMALYALEIHENINEKSEKSPLSSTSILNDILSRRSFDIDQKKYIKSLFNLSVKNKAKCEEEIKTRLNNWEFDRVALIDRILLTLAICEIRFLDEVPPKVSISEAIELAKEYSTSESSSFVNGVLDKIYQSLNESINA
tara:strand:- start:7047 stop:7511 length:465 start_codon:yes stop_codon:yes gene_type:complete